MKRILCIITVLVLLLFSCWPDQVAIFFIYNKSEDSVYVFETHFSDSLLPNKKPELLVVPSKENSRMVDDVFNTGYLNNKSIDYVYFFFLDKLTVDHVSWNTIKDSNLVLKRYKVSYEELINEMEGKIYYP